MTRRLNIPAIEKSLRNVKREFHVINKSLSDRRDPFTDEVIANMVEGYQRIDDYLAKGINPFEVGHSKYMLELNHIVLCGRDNRGEQCYEKQLSASKKHFYSDEGGIADVMDWLDIHNDSRAWLQAAGMFTRILSQPQLFIEGNHRTGALLMSYWLVSHGKPPFVLTAENARHFFEPASLIKKKKKKGLDKLLRLPRLAKQLARQLKQDARRSFLL